MSAPLLPAGPMQPKPLPTTLPLELEVSFRNAACAGITFARDAADMPTMGAPVSRQHAAMEKLKQAVVDVHGSLHARLGAVAAASRAGVVGHTQAHAGWLGAAASGCSAQQQAGAVFSC
jgi:hypothetical protein